jgi:hypothetical protein
MEILHFMGKFDHTGCMVNEPRILGALYDLFF